jgi:hypothetical protein
MAPALSFAQRALRILVVLMLADLVFLQHGRFPSIDGFPVRFVLFALTLATAAILLVWLPGDQRYRFIAPVRPWLLGTVLLLGLLVPCWGTVRGWAEGIAWGALANDANGHLYYWAALPMALTLGGGETGWLLRVLQRIVVVFCLVCLAVYGAAVMNAVASDFVEHTLRTRELGFLNEFTDGRPYRLFFKSYIFVVVVCCLAAYRVALRQADRWDWVAFILTAAVLWNSYTRSIWVVVLLALVAVAALHWRRRCLKIVLPAAAAGLLAIPFLWGGATGGLLRLDDRDGTVGMRWQQAGDLAESFRARPLTGAGFGAPVDSVSGYSVELDLLNLARKIGLLGVGLYVLAFLLPAVSAWRQWSTSSGCPEAVAAFVVTFIAVFGMGAANPYATASLGIGAMCIALATLSAAEAT